MEETTKTAPGPATTVPAAGSTDPAPTTERGLLEEILETTRERERLGLIELEDAIRRAETRARALGYLADEAVSETEPHQWTLFSDKDGAQRLRMKVSAALKVATYFGISWDYGDPHIAKDEDADKRFCLVVGTARSSVTGLEFPVRAKRFEHEDFTGRRLRTRDDGSTTGVNVGLQDVIDSTISLFITKATILLSGVHSISVEKASKLWGHDTVAKTLEKITAGHGARPKDQGKAGGARTVTGAQGKMLWAKSKARLQKVGATGVEPDDLVAEAVVAICGEGVTVETAPIGCVDKLVQYINAYGSDQ